MNPVLHFAASHVWKRTVSKASSFFFFLSLYFWHCRIGEMIGSQKATNGLKQLMLSFFWCEKRGCFIWFLHDYNGSGWLNITHSYHTRRKQLLILYFISNQWLIRCRRSNNGIRQPLSLVTLKTTDKGLHISQLLADTEWHVTKEPLF